jgi:hypothetical protein
VKESGKWFMSRDVHSNACREARADSACCRWIVYAKEQKNERRNMAEADCVGGRRATGGAASPLGTMSQERGEGQLGVENKGKRDRKIDRRV